MIIKNNTLETQVLGFVDQGLELSPAEEYTIESYKIRNNPTFKDMLEAGDLIIVEYDEELIEQPAERVTIEDSPLGDTLQEVITNLEENYYRTTGEFVFKYISLEATDEDAIMYDASGCLPQQTLLWDGLLTSIIVELSSIGSVDVDVFVNDELVETVSVDNTTHAISDLNLEVSAEDYVTAKVTPTEEEFITQNVQVRVAYAYGVVNPEGEPT